MEQVFKIGEEVTCKLDGNKAYVVERFRAVMVTFKGKLKVIPERYITEDGKGSAFFGLKKGLVIDKKTLYVVHLANGQLKIASAEILLKGHKKVIPVFSGKNLKNPKLN